MDPSVLPSYNPTNGKNCRNKLHFNSLRVGLRVLHFQFVGRVFVFAKVVLQIGGCVLHRPTENYTLNSVK